MNKCAILAYAPPDDPRWNSKVFLANLAEHPPENPLVLFSDYPWGVPGLIRLRGSPDVHLKDAKNKWAIHNAMFFTALKIADKQGFDYFIFLESDCRTRGRFGKKWDTVIFQEFFSATEPPIVAGTVCVYNPSAGGPAAALRYRDLVLNRNTRKNFPITSFVPTFGWKEQGDSSGSCVFAMGAGAVYSVAGMKTLFSEDERANTIGLAVKCQPYDKEIGTRLWSKFGVGAYDKVLHLDSIYSGYGNVLTTEAQRQEMLTSGAIVLGHQFKSAFKPKP